MTKKLLDYLTFGFPLGGDRTKPIISTAQDNHSSAREWPQAVSEFIKEELDQGALLGPFDEPPHTHYTWAPLLTRPKGNGRRVILDLSFGDYSVNGATCKEFYDNSSFTLKLPSLDNLIGALQS